MNRDLLVGEAIAVFVAAARVEGLTWGKVTKKRTLWDTKPAPESSIGSTSHRQSMTPDILRKKM